MHRPHKRPATPDERVFPSIWNSSEAWAACAKALREYDEDMIQDWKEEIDTLLVFAGLFSAVVTTFNIESYKLLQQQSEDSVVTILTQISSQLNSFTVNTNFINTTQPADVVDLVHPFRPNAFAVRLNTMWFSSLVCGLLSASLSLLVKQWLREYLAGSSDISRESIRIRQYRYEGLRRWHVPEIILFLPILLQAALLLFFVGLVDLLWTLHAVVAAVVTTIIAVSMLFAIITSLLPPLCADCPYKSPQSRIICVITQSIKRSVARTAAHYHARIHHRSQSQARHGGASTPDPFASKLDLPAMMPSRLSETLRGWVHRLSLVRPYASWKEREKHATETSGAAAALDDATLAGADAIFMDDTFLHAVVRPCMSDIAPPAALRCLDRILLRRAPRVLNDMPYWEPACPLDSGRGGGGMLTLSHLLLDVLHRLSVTREREFVVEAETNDGGEGGGDKDEPRRRLLLTMHRLVRAIPTPNVPDRFPAPDDEGNNAQTCALFRRMFEVLAGVLDAEARRAIPERFVRERSFNLMLKLFQRFQAVGPTCIQAFCAYSNQMRMEDSPYRFVQACYMVIRASAVLARDAHVDTSLTVSDAGGSSPPSSLPYVVGDEEDLLQASPASSMTLYAEPFQVDDDACADAPAAEYTDFDTTHEYASVRPAVLRVLHDLEGFLSAPVCRAAEYRPTPAMFAECAQAVLALAARDRGAVSPALVAALSNMVFMGAGDDGPGEHGDDAVGGERWDHDVQVARQAVRVLGKMYGVHVHGRLDVGGDAGKCGMRVDIEA